MTDQRYCCRIIDGQGCTNPVRWTVGYGLSPDDWTDTCEDHAAEMIDGPLLWIEDLRVPAR